MLSFFESFSALSFMIDFFWASLFLLVGTVLRANIKFLQNLFIPASVIAGLLGLLFSEEFFNIIDFSDQVGSYPTVLIILLFASMLLGHQENTGGSLGKRLLGYRDTIWVMFMWSFLQFGLAMLVSVLLANTLLPDMNPAFGLLMPGGFYGGYGYGAAIGGTLESYGLENGVGIGCTFATIGMVVGIGLGMLNINIANRKGWLKFTKKLGDIPKSERTGLLPKELRTSLGTATVNANSIDPLCFHVSLIFLVGGFAWMTEYYVNQLTGISVPALSIAIVYGAALQALLNKSKVGHYVDKGTTTRIGSTITDYLVFFGFCTIKKAVVADYWLPILIFSLLGIIVNTFMLFYISPRGFHNNWFERAIIFFGEFSGVMATGVTLLRVVDTENESGALEGAGVANVPVCFADLFQIGMYPVFCGMGFTALTGGLVTAGAMVMLAMMFITKCWHKPDYKR